MRPKHILYLLLLMFVMLSACVSAGVIPETVSSTSESATLTVTPMPTDTPTLTTTQLPSPTAIPPTTTPTQVPTVTPPPTLEPEQAEETMRTLLREPVDCLAPCFWGIIPGQTTLDEARAIFAKFGLEMASTTYEGKDFHGIRYKFDSGMSIIVTLTVQDDLVMNLRVDILPEKYQPGVPREWLAYSPETLIERYGAPSRVEFFLGRGEPATDFAMVIYFDAVDLIVLYGGTDLFTPITSLQVCPLTARFDGVFLWLGKNPEHPPGHVVPLEEATSLTLEAFAELMTRNPERACLELKDEAFP